MYAYSLAAAITRIPHDTQRRLDSILIAQPPADDMLGNAAMYHYTWGVDLLDPKRNYAKVWQWDKRKFVSGEDSFKIPHIPMPPPVAEIQERGLYQHYPQKKRMTKELAESFHQMIGIMNEAADNLPALRPCGWAHWPAC
mmetsp:Transcript_4092/g.8403  ORF Transcript_4092/g.8403 Transcript_4092/m.8403 type:complete len:140 (-) Transcript_4092:112-531(-)